jgi:hypothetical protein
LSITDRIVRERGWTLSFAAETPTGLRAIVQGACVTLPADA